MTRIWRVVFVTSLLQFVTACALTGPFAATPRLSGDYAVGSIDADWRHEGTGANRRLKIRVWYPALRPGSGAETHPYLTPAEAPGTIEAIERFLETPGALSNLANVKTRTYENALRTGAARYPIVFFNHGFWFYLAQNTALMESLASHGYIVVSVAHPGDSMPVHYADGVVEDTISYKNEESGPGERAFFSDSSHATRVGAYPTYQAEIQGQRILRSLQTWRADLRAVVDDLQSGAVPESVRALREQVDFSRIVFAGMSFGGAVAASTCVTDERCDAAINLDGFQYDAALFDHDFGKPLLIVNSDWVAHRIGERSQSPNFSMDDYFYEDFDSTAPAHDIYRVRVRNIKHLGFTDLPLFAPPDVRVAKLGELEPSEAVKGVNEMILAFCDRYLRGRAAEFPGAVFARHHDFIHRDAADVRRWRASEAATLPLPH